MWSLFGLLGLLVGSFLNVLVLRRGILALGGRSACMSCGHSIAWYDNVPVLSWLALRGRCRHCKSSISPQYPLVEAATGALFALVGNAPVGAAYIVGALALLSILIAIVVYDLRHTVIPDEWVYSFALGALALQVLVPFPDGGTFVLRVLSGPLASLPLFALWFVSRGRWMGFGDVKLALGIGWLLGPLWGVYAVLFSFVLGALVSILVLLPLPYVARLVRAIVPRFAAHGKGIGGLNTTHTGFTMKSEVPFGPFLAASCVSVWLLLLYGITIPLTLIPY